MSIQYQPNTLTSRNPVLGLSRIRIEWQATEGVSLIDVNASVGLLLADVVDALELGQDEKVAVLGEDLLKELELFAGVE